MVSKKHFYVYLQIKLRAIKHVFIYKKKLWAIQLFMNEEEEEDEEQGGKYKNS